MTPVDVHGRAVSGESGTHPTRVRLRWRVGAETARRVFGVECREAHLEIELTKDDGRLWRARALVEGDGAEARPVLSAETSAAWSSDAARRLLHLDASGVLHATFDMRNGTPRVLYARTGVLGEVGLPGGRYEIAGASFDFAG